VGRFARGGCAPATAADVASAGGGRVDDDWGCVGGAGAEDVAVGFGCGSACGGFGLVVCADGGRLARGQADDGAGGAGERGGGDALVVVVGAVGRQQSSAFADVGEGFDTGGVSEPACAPGDERACADAGPGAGADGGGRAAWDE
jgi:hypothetical protein